MGIAPGRLPGVRRALSATASADPRLVVFESWHGAYNDSPRALSEELWRRHGERFAHVWALRTPASTAPDWARVVEPESAAYLRALGRAGYLVTNNAMPGYYRKPAFTTYVQTWHGTPLKRIAFDIPAGSAATPPRYLRDLRRDVAAWDFLISPNGFSTEVFRGAFGYGGRILETGYPRNDLLSGPDRHRVRTRTREELAIGDGQIATLYAPTWRDNDSFALELDVRRALDELGEGHVLLLRTHQLVAGTAAIPEHERLRDVSSWVDNRELYVAADALVTDYSSVMFDFAVTGRPILLFTYDLEEYRDELRGFYFNLEEEAPGPLLRTTDQVIAALADLAAVAAEHERAYAAFRERFCALEDGGAGARVIDAVFEGRG